MTKGSSFEREVARKLSIWWTQDDAEPREDVFWRTTTSGARATSRAKGGKKTKNSHGDICAIDPVGQPLIDLITWELKRGYSRASIQDLLDKGHKSAKQTYQKWIETAVRDHERAGSFSWVLVVKRDKREPLAIFPDKLSVKLLPVKWDPSASVVIKIEEKRIDLDMMPLDDLLKMVTPEDIRIA